MKISVLIDGQTFVVEVENIHARPVIATIDEMRYEVWPEKEVSESDRVETAQKTAPAVSVPAPVQSAKLVESAAQYEGSKEVTSPLPGVIVDILVEPGDSVSHGQELCTLEAMKMKNAIRANREGIIASIKVDVGDQVTHGQVMMVYKE